MNPHSALAMVAHTKLNADQSAWLLADKIRAEEPFFFIRYGDGALECIAAQRGMTCDGEKYSPGLGLALLEAWSSLMRQVRSWGPPVYAGDWLSASFTERTRCTRYDAEYAALVGHGSPTNWLHFETLLLMRESDALLDFYRAVRISKRRKLFMGPAGNAGAAQMLGADFLETPMRDLFSHADALTEKLRGREFDILLYGAGMAGNIPAVRCWEQYPERTYVALGSAMDPLFRGRSRRQQLLPNRAREFFKELL